jgi:C4-dicarboxylate-specific signal transduction histidine kinase
MIIDAQIYKLKGQIAAGRLTPEQFEKGLSLIELTTDRIARIVRGLKSLSRNSEHDPVESVVLSRLVAETIDLCEQRFASKDIRLTVSKECDPGLEVVVRPSQLGQVLLNLLNNAYDAVENLSEKWVNLAYTAQESHCVIRITDSGSGIPSVILEKIMQPFFTTKEVGKGTGLGLSISKKIIEDHGGKFSYDPNSPHTSFVIELPLTK